MSASTGQKLFITGSTFALTWGMVQHGGEGAIVAAVLASLVLSNADKIVDKFAGEKSPQTVSDDDYPTEEEIAAYREMQRILGQGQHDGQDTLPTPEEIAVYQEIRQQLEMRKQSHPELGNPTAIAPNTLGSDFDALLTATRFEFSHLLSTGWRPSMNEIFLARLPDGTNVFVTVEQLVHIALSGATRNGKTSIIRQLLSQLIYVGCDCILLDPHFTPYDVAISEDWTPFVFCKGKVDQFLREIFTK